MGLVILSGSSPYLVSPMMRDIIINTVQTYSVNELQEILISQLDGYEEEREDG